MGTKLKKTHEDKIITKLKVNFLKKKTENSDKLLVRKIEKKELEQDSKVQIKSKKEKENKIRNMVELKDSKKSI